MEIERDVLDRRRLLLALGMSLLPARGLPAALRRVRHAGRRRHSAGGGAAQQGALVLDVRDYGAKGDGATDDTAAIQAALDAAQDAGGGVVYLPPAFPSYRISQLSIAQSRIALVGAGHNITQLSQISGQALDAIACVGNPAPSSYLVLRGFYLDGNVSEGNTGNGITVTSYNDVVIEDVQAQNCGHDGFHLTNGTGGGSFYIRLCRAGGNAKNGVFADIDGFSVEQSLFSGNGSLDMAPDTGNQWYQQAGGEGYFSGCAFDGVAGATGGDGLALASGSRYRVSACYMHANRRNGLYLGCSDSVIVGNLIYGNSRIAAGAYHGITLPNNASGGNTIVGNRVANERGQTGGQRGIIESGTSDNNVIANNDVRNNSIANLAWVGVGTRVSGNLGFNPQGFTTITPALPDGTGLGSALANGYPFPVRIYQTGAKGTHIVDAFGTDRSLGSDPAELTLDPGANVYYTASVPSSWIWYGT